MHVPAQTIPLYFKIWQDHPNTHYFAYYLEYLTFHLPEERVQPALEWLIKNKITGEKFLRFVKEDCQRSGLEFIRQLTMRIEKEKKTRALTIMDIQ